MLSRNAVRDVYRRTASVYDVWAALTEGRTRRRVEALSAVVDGERVLEVAVGTGLLFERILHRNPHGIAVGVDLTPAMLARARARAVHSAAPQHWHLQVGDALALAFGDGAFDVVLNCYMFDLLPEADFLPVLEEMHRVLRPGGRLVVANLAPVRSPVYALWERLHSLNPALVGGCRGIRLSADVIRAGFAIATREEVTQLGVTSEVIAARRP